jgi:hypothetical protein
MTTRQCPAPCRAIVNSDTQAGAGSFAAGGQLEHTAGLAVIEAGKQVWERQIRVERRSSSKMSPSDMLRPGRPLCPVGCLVLDGVCGAWRRRAQRRLGSRRVGRGLGSGAPRVRRDGWRASSMPVNGASGPLMRRISSAITSGDGAMLRSTSLRLSRDRPLPRTRTASEIASAVTTAPGRRPAGLACFIKSIITGRPAASAGTSTCLNACGSIITGRRATSGRSWLLVRRLRPREGQLLAQMDQFGENLRPLYRRG